MGYLKGKEILPPEVVALIQQYVDGEYIYIPRKEENRKSWGDTTGCRKALEERDTAIYREYLSGKRAEELAEAHYLSVKSIQRIITKEKKKQQASCQPGETL